MQTLKVSSKSNPNSVAGALAGIMKVDNEVDLQTVGAGALNQSVKAIAIARGFIAPLGRDLVCTPSFAEIEILGETRTAIKFHVTYK